MKVYITQKFTNTQDVPRLLGLSGWVISYGLLVNGTYFLYGANRNIRPLRNGLSMTVVAIFGNHLEEGLELVI